MRIKVCGITSLLDAKAAVEAGAYALGFNFFTASPRYINPYKVADIISDIAKHILKVGIFVNASPEDIKQQCQISGINIVQLHGHEKASDFYDFPLPIIKAIQLTNADDLVQIKTWQFADAILIDAYCHKQYGGTGNLANWHLAKIACQQCRVILAGGINASNIKAAASQVNPFAFDVCSGVEQYPGTKSIKKLNELFNVMECNSD